MPNCGFGAFESVRIFRRRDHVAFVGLTAIQLAALAAGAAYWLLHGTVTPAYVLASLLLAAWLALWQARWLALPLMARPTAVAPPAGLRVAAVTTFVPSKEPLAMLETTVRAMLAMRYPHDTWVLDEEGEPEVAELCERLGARYFTRTATAAAEVKSGPLARGTKHGNYNVWLTAIGFASYDVLAAFDPDHVPRSDYLLRTLGYLRADQVGYVQAAPGFYNQAESFVARGAAEETYTYWSATVMAAYGAGHVALNGSHNVHRLAALAQAGGFADHDGDDYLLTLLYRTNGWQGVLVPEHLALGTSPSTWGAYLRQQRRWARSLVDIKLRKLPSVIRRLPRGDRVAAALQGLLFLFGAATPLMLAIAAAWLAAGSAPAPLAEGWPYYGPGVLAIVLCEKFRQRFAAAHERGLHWRGLLVRFAKWPHLVLAIVEALHGRRRPYELTEKGRGAHAEWIAPATHAAAAVMVSAAWAAGMLSGGMADPGLHVAASLLVAVSLVAAALTSRSVRTPAAQLVVSRRRLREHAPEAVQ